MLPIGPIPRYLSCLSSFSSQPSPFPLPFHSHWFSLFSQCRSRSVTLIHSPFDNSQNSHWSVFIHDEIRIVSRAASTEHPNPPSIASFWDSSEIRVQPQRGWSCVFVFSSLFSTPCTRNLCSCYFPIFASFIILFSLFPPVLSSSSHISALPFACTFLFVTHEPEANMDNLRMIWEPLCIHSISLSVHYHVPIFTGVPFLTWAGSHKANTWPVAQYLCLMWSTLNHNIHTFLNSIFYM